MNRNDLHKLGFAFLLSFSLFFSGCGTSDATGNKLPVADAGDDIVVIQNKLFTFDASNSYDLDGNITSYEWFCSDFNITLYKGPKNKLIMPAQRAVGTYNTKLIVTDDKNATTEDTLLVKILAPTVIANAGDDIVVIQNEMFTFDASKSHSLEGNITSYEWYCTDFNISLYKGPESNLTIPAQRAVGVYNTKLIVTNELNETAEDMVVIRITEPNGNGDNQDVDTLNTGITIDQFKILQQEGIVYIDIRTEQEHISTGIIEGSNKIINPSNISIWLQDGSDFLNLVTDQNQRFVLICAAGGRAFVTANALKDEGYTNAHYLTGGINAWISEEEPTVPVN